MSIQPGTPYAMRNRGRLSRELITAVLNTSSLVFLFGSVGDFWSSDKKGAILLMVRQSVSGGTGLEGVEF